MAKAWLYNPENDLALASNSEHYTAPKPVMRMIHECELLPAWLASEGDTILTQRASREAALMLRKEFGLPVTLNRVEPGMLASPWGWSPVAAFRLRGLGLDGVPSEGELQTLRNLSHRRTSVACRRYIGEEPGVEALSVQDIAEFAAANGAIYSKNPWSCSGRGVRLIEAGGIERHMLALTGTIRRQGSVILERAWGAGLDCAALFSVERGEVEFAGWSMFVTEPGGRYGGNVVASQEAIRQRIEGAMEHPGELVPTVRRVADFLVEAIAPHYSGPVGVDMLVDGHGQLHGCIEINLRFTMGFVARGVWDRLGREGLLVTSPGTRGLWLVPSGRMRLVDEPTGRGDC